MTVETEVANLTTAVDNLASAVNVKKATLDASVADAQSAQSAAASSATTASGHATSAAASAAAAASTASGIAGFDLDAIAASKAVTAVDVFVYDTSKDSDGGAWRKRCQHTSWYNETLNTATRGSRREFPAVAVIVAESNKLTIYDGDDPDLPMWMIFTGDGSSTFDGTDKFLNATSYDYTCCSAKNGVVCMGSARGSEDNRYDYGLSVISFIDDTAARWMNNKVKEWPHGIGKRESALTFSPDDTSRRLVSGMVNDVAMTVLPNAPIDAATGLPVPTIAVATNGGVSVIKDDGTVVDIAPHTSDFEAVDVAFNEQCHIIYHERFSATSDSQIVVFHSIPVADAVQTDADEIYGADTGKLPRLAPSEVVDSFVLGSIDSAGQAFSVSEPIQGLSLLYNNPANQGDGMVAYTTSTYNTGWMNGDIKGAFLADTDSLDLVGSGELVTNGTFDTDTSGWTAARSATLTWVSGAMQISYGGTDYPQAQQTLTTVAGQRYKLQVTQTAGVALSAVVGTAAGGNQLGSVSGTGALTLDFVATSTSSYITLQANATGSVSVTVDNISVKLADADRSVNNNGLIVNGTVTRSAVATGAELVAYSGFSASNYLEQPYNSALDFGTGDFCVMGWFNTDSTSGVQILLDTRDNAFDSGILFYLDAGRLYLDTKASAGGSTVTTSADLRDGAWHFVVATRTSSGTLLAAYVDGNLANTASVTARDVSTTSSPSFVGIRSDLSASQFGGSLALLRISATAPTAEQIKKIYEDEKVLFQENAACTLYGASDAVTALAHDSDTNLLHVGTSAGRSVFQGLRRVSNTTTAVGTAISASNGLVVEE